jgi:hypothetical protein
LEQVRIELKSKPVNAARGVLYAMAGGLANGPLPHLGYTIATDKVATH